MSQTQDWAAGFDNYWTRMRSKRATLTVDIKARLTKGDIPPPDLKDIEYGSEEYKRIYEEIVSKVLQMAKEMAPEQTAKRGELELEVKEWLFVVQGEQQGMLFSLDEDF